MGGWQRGEVEPDVLVTRSSLQDTVSPTISSLLTPCWSAPYLLGGSYQPYDQMTVLARVVCKRPYLTLVCHPPVLGGRAGAILDWAIINELLTTVSQCDTVDDAWCVTGGITSIYPRRQKVGCVARTLHPPALSDMKPASTRWLGMRYLRKKATRVLSCSIRITPNTTDKTSSAMVSLTTLCSHGE